MPLEDKNGQNDTLDNINAQVHADKVGLYLLEDTDDLGAAINVAS